MLLDIHATWAWVMIIANGLAGIWALLAWRKPAFRSRAMWWFVIFAQVSVFIQVGLGVAMVSLQKKNPPKFHMFYGFIALIFIAIMYSYRVSMRHRLYAVYGFSGLFLMGLGIRALMKA